MWTPVRNENALQTNVTPLQVLFASCNVIAHWLELKACQTD